MVQAHGACKGAQLTCLGHLYARPAQIEEWGGCVAELLLGIERKRLVRRVTQHGEFAEFAPNTQNT